MLRSGKATEEKSMPLQPNDESRHLDESWFADHPERSHRTRFATPGEIAAFVAFTGCLPSEVIAVMTAIRQFDTGLVVPIILGVTDVSMHPDDADEAAAEAFFKLAVQRLPPLSHTGVIGSVVAH
jgi:hypothetical protein